MSQQNANVERLLRSRLDEIQARIAELAKQTRVTPAQIAIAWILAQKPWIVPIPGTTKLSRLEENIGAVSLKLSADDLNLIEQALAGIKVEGARYPAALQQNVGR